jgi:hypothetical protein
VATGTDDGPTEPHGLIKDRYAFGSITRRGGADVAYLPRDAVTGHDVAVKVLRRYLADSTVDQRFRRSNQLRTASPTSGRVPTHRRGTA